jgi:hypothetical protein
MPGGFHTHDLWSLALAVARLRLVLKLIQAIRKALPKELNGKRTTCAEGIREEFRRRLAASGILRLSGMGLGEPRSNLTQLIARQMQWGTFIVECCARSRTRLWGSLTAALSRRARHSRPSKLKVNFLRPVWNAKVRAEARMFHAGRTISLVQCNVFDASPTKADYQKQFSWRAQWSARNRASRQSICHNWLNAPVRECGPATSDHRPEKRPTSGRIPRMSSGFHAFERGQPAATLSKIKAFLQKENPHFSELTIGKKRAIDR